VPTRTHCATLCARRPLVCASRPASRRSRRRRLVAAGGQRGRRLRVRLQARPAAAQAHAHAPQQGRAEGALRCAPVAPSAGARAAQAVHAAGHIRHATHTRPPLPVPRTRTRRASTRTRRPSWACCWRRTSRALSCRSSRWTPRSSTSRRWMTRGWPASRCIAWPSTAGVCVRAPPAAAVQPLVHGATCGVMQQPDTMQPRMRPPHTATTAPIPTPTLEGAGRAVPRHGAARHLHGVRV
jgi:hypothetical protein